MTAAVSDPENASGPYWLWQLGYWGVLFVIQFLILWRMNAAAPVNALILIGTLTIELFVASHWLRAYSNRKSWLTLPPRALVLRLVLAGALLAAFITALDAALVIYLRNEGFVLLPQTLRDSLMLTWLSTFVSAVGYLWLWTAGYFGFEIIRQRQRVIAEEARLRASLRTAELNLLKSQLNPHFLFNALNTVRALIAESPQRAEKAVTQLARTIRYSLNSSRDELVTLANELEIVDDYLGIEELRLAERLTLTRDIAAEALRANIPIMLLQTLVENAVKHGISQLPQGGTLHISARMDADTLIIEVTNDRPLIKMGSVPSDRVGLANAHERLRLMIGPTATLALDLSAPQSAKATVRIPQSAV
jgi:LytS/YehU family sensor histidine kinase